MEKIITLLLAGAMLASSSAVLAAEDTDLQVTPIAAEDASQQAEMNTYEGKVTAVEKNTVSIEIALEDDADVMTVTFYVDEDTDLGGKKLEDIKKDDVVVISSTASLKTKDIKPASKIEIKTEDTEEDAATDAESTMFFGTVSSVKDNLLNVDIETEDGVVSVSYLIEENSIIVDLEGNDVEEIKEGEKITIFSKSDLKTKDIKSFDAAVVGDNEKTSAVLGKFSIGESGLLYNESYMLELYVSDEKTVEECDGKTLLVLYDLVTLSIPAKTNPIAIIICDDEEDEKPAEDDKQEESKPVENVSISFKVGDSILSINGKDVEVQTPYVVGAGHTLVPLRVISEAFGAKVDWNGDTKTVSIAYDGKEIKLQIANDTALVDGKDTVLDAAPVLEGAGYTMVPLRFISETLGAKVDYDNDTKAVTVSK